MKVRVWLCCWLMMMLAGVGTALADAPVRLAMGVLPQSSPLLLVGTVFRDCSDCPEMVVMPLGDTYMGAQSGEEEAEGVESRFRGRSEPRHRVFINNAFAVGRYEVTVGQFARFVQATGRKMDGCWISQDHEWKLLEDRSWRMPGYGQTDRDPVVCVSW